MVYGGMVVYGTRYIVYSYGTSTRYQVPVYGTGRSYCTLCQVPMRSFKFLVGLKQSFSPVQGIVRVPVCVEG